MIKARRLGPALLALLILAGPAGLPALGQGTGEAPAAPAQAMDIKIALITRAVPPPPLYDLLATPEDEAVKGAELAIKDNATTGQFTGQNYSLETVTLEDGEDAVAAARAQVEAGAKFIALNLSAADVLAVADQLKDTGAAFLNVGATDDALRGADCRANMFHVAPSRAMLTDALAQFLAFKKWRNLALVVGDKPADALYAAALKRSAQKFGLKVVAEKPWTFGPLARERADSITRSDALILTRGIEADVLVVADEANDFGNYIPFRTFEPRLVVGTQGLVAATWHPAQDAFGSAQLQSRFLRLAGRPMRAADYQAWLAVRMVGEAATRAASADPAAITKVLRAPDFSLAAFKGVPLSVRPWDQQVRQPLLIAQPLAIVSVAPEEGFLHQRTPLDTLGMDQPETACKLSR